MNYVGVLLLDELLTLLDCLAVWGFCAGLTGGGGDGGVFYVDKLSVALFTQSCHLQLLVALCLMAASLQYTSHHCFPLLFWLSLASFYCAVLLSVVRRFIRISTFRAVLIDLCGVSFDPVNVAAGVKLLFPAVIVLFPAVILLFPAVMLLFLVVIHCCHADIPCCQITVCWKCLSFAALLLCSVNMYS